jgi:hypothetical protein
MSKRHRVRALLIPLLATAFLLAGQLPAFAPHAGSDAVFHPLAICRDGIQFLFWADYYPAGPDNPADHQAPDRIQSVQAATPVPPADANGRITPPADTLVLNTTSTCRTPPSCSTSPPSTRHRCLPSTRRRSPCPGLPPTDWPPICPLRRWSVHAAVGPQAQGGAAVGGVELRPL